MSEPIPVQVTRYRCPSCGRTANSRSRAREHMARCWLDPENRGCKTCRLFDQTMEGEFCGAGVNLAGKTHCKRCDGFGFTPDGADVGHACPECDNDPDRRDEVKGGPIIRCAMWQIKDDEE